MCRRGRSNVSVPVTHNLLLSSSTQLTLLPSETCLSHILQAETTAVGYAIKLHLAKGESAYAAPLYRSDMLC